MEIVGLIAAGLLTVTGVVLLFTPILRSPSDGKSLGRIPSALLGAALIVGTLHNYIPLSEPLRIAASVAAIALLTPLLAIQLGYGKRR